MNQYATTCTACSKPTYSTCDTCKKAYCTYGACLYETGEWITEASDPRNEDYAENPTWRRKEELCMTCYTQKVGHAPFTLWADTFHTSSASLNVNGVVPGSIAYADDMHIWYAPPQAGEMLRLRWDGKEIELDAFRTLQLLNYLKSNEAMIREQAAKTGGRLVQESREETERTLRAGAGIVDYSQYE